MPVTEMIVGISAGLLMLGAFVFLLRLIQAWMLHRTLRDAITRDSSVAESLIDRLERGDRRRAQMTGDDRTGLVLIAIGIALAGYAVIIGNDEWLRYLLGAALFPTLVGIVLLGRHAWLSRRRNENDVAAG